MEAFIASAQEGSGIIEAPPDGCDDPVVGGAVVELELFEQAAARSNSPKSEAPSRGVVFTMRSSVDVRPVFTAASKSLPPGRHIACPSGEPAHHLLGPRHREQGCFRVAAARCRNRHARIQSARPVHSDAGGQRSIPARETWPGFCQITYFRRAEGTQMRYPYDVRRPPLAAESHIEGGRDDVGLALYRTIMFVPSGLSRAEREAMAVCVSAVNDCHY